MTNFYTYLHCKPDGTPFYVGKGCARRAFHIGKPYFRNEHHLRVVEKYGRKNILIFVFPCESEEQAFADEIQQIAQLRLEGYVLANATNGGEGASGRVNTEIEKQAKRDWWKAMPEEDKDTLREKLRIAQKERHESETPDERRKRSSSMIGNKYGVGNKNHLGKKHSPETRLKMSLKKIGKPAHNKGATHSEESKHKMSESHKGSVAWNKGVPRTPEQNASHSKLMTGRVRTEESKRKTSETLRNRHAEKKASGQPWKKKAAKLALEMSYE